MRAGSAGGSAPRTASAAVAPAAEVEDRALADLGVELGLGAGGLRASSTASMPRRVAPVEPNAPHLISASIDFLLTVRQSTRSQKSHSYVNGPPSSRARLIASTAA